MTRPRCCCTIKFHPKATMFRPEDCNQKESGIVQLTMEEAEALRLKNIEELDQTAAAERMGISQSTFQRILMSAYKKVSEAIVFGKALKIT